MISYGLSITINSMFGMEMGLQSVIPVWLALGGVGFSAVIAMISGLYPALRAMRLSALAAIRNQ